QLRNAEWGISSSTTQNQGVSISNSTFDTNQHNIRLGGTAPGCSITYNTIAVGPNSGIELLGAGATIAHNVITLTSSSTIGIKVDNTLSSATIDDNQVLGPASGSYPSAGIWLGQGSSTVTSNTIQHCADGVYIGNGTHNVGAHNGGNTIQLNT